MVDQLDTTLHTGPEHHDCALALREWAVDHPPADQHDRIPAQIKYLFAWV